MSSSKPDAEPEFDWIKVQRDYGLRAPETAGDRFVRKATENPFVPIGVLLTTGALIYGLWSFKNGRKEMSQYMMRTRVLAQGFTVTALVLGLVFSVAREPKT